MKWICVFDRLPEGNEEVLVFAEGWDRATIGRYSRGHYWIAENTTTDVTHWMELPHKPQDQS
jgi:hypothetical protein